MNIKEVLAPPNVLADFAAQGRNPLLRGLAQRAAEVGVMATLA